MDINPTGERERGAGRTCRQDSRMKKMPLHVRGTSIGQGSICKFMVLQYVTAASTLQRLDHSMEYSLHACDGDFGRPCE